MSMIEAVIQGIIQGLTEFLPISSSGHLSLFQYFTGRNGETGALFSILLHLGTLLAVCIAFYKTILCMVVEFFAIIRDIFTGRFSFREMSNYRKMIFLLIVSLLPMAITFLFLDFFSGLSSDNSIVAEGLGFLATSALLTLSVRCVKGRKTSGTTTYKDALAMGFMQSVAPIPGISRSGSTISVGLLCGLEREFAVSFSFIMGVPTVLGANILEIGPALKTGLDIPAHALIAGLVASLVFGLLAIWMVRWLVVGDKFIWFARYTFVLGVITLIIGLIDKFAGYPVQQWIIGLVGGGS